MKPMILEQVVVGTVRLELQRRIPLLVANNQIEFYTRVNDWAKELAIGLHVKLAGRKEEVQIERVERVPLDWWQALRQRWFPQWWLRRWPVRERQIVVKELHEHWHVCPHIPTPLNREHFAFVLPKTNGEPLPPSR